jgi:ribosome-interacting GTPase 1
MKLNIDYMLETIWKLLNLIRVYTKKRGEKPDFEGGLIIRSGTTVEHVVSFLLLNFSIYFILYSVV